jgi:hypothetical protein
MELGDFICKSGEYSHLTVTFIAFISGIISSLLIYLIRQIIEKNNLIEIFILDIYTNWREVSMLNLAPEKINSHRVRFYLKNIHVTFSGEPEFEYEVYNIKFFETEGFKLLHHLRKKTKQEFWEVYTLIRDAESTRKIIKTFPEDHKDRSSYQKLFVKLVEKLATKLIDFQKSLFSELPRFKQSRIVSIRT